MCGICGFAGAGVKGNEEDKARLRVMTARLVHRGPDDSGIHAENGVGFGHRRLSIVDLAGGHQPMSTPYGDLTVVFNGEIYNHQELRAELESKGHVFKTRCDTEVLLYAYREWGRKFPRRLNGMFAFALWDANEKRLMLCRDRLGIRPLYYAVQNGNLYFASETKALLALPDIPREVDCEALDLYLTFRYVPGTLTMLRHIHKLAPGNTLIFEKGHAHLYRYWKLPEVEHPDDRPVSELTEEFFALFNDSVRLRLMSDVPLGAYLSGGVDSASVVASMKRQMSNAAVKTFTVGFGTAADELNEAGETARLLGTDHHVIRMESDAFRMLSDITYHMDEPLGDAIIIPMALLSKLASEHVKVVLTGEGADEILGGYVHHWALHWGEKYQRYVPSLFKKNLAAPLLSLLSRTIIDRWIPYPASLGEAGRDRLRKYAAGPPSLGSSYTLMASLFSGTEKQNLYGKSFCEQISEKRSAERADREFLHWGGRSALDKVIRYDLKNWLPDNILFKQDKTAMMHSVEGRVPFLDHRLVEFCLRLPNSLKIRGRQQKVLLRRAMRELIPASAGRAKKAFHVPVEQCFGKPFEAYVQEHLSEERIREQDYFTIDGVRSVMQARERSPFVASKQLICLLVLELWHDRILRCEPDHTLSPLPSGRPE